MTLAKICSKVGILDPSFYTYIRASVEDVQSG